MAGGAIERRVRAHQRKTVLVLFDLLNRDLPPLHRVALLTRCSELPLVDIGMAIRAFLTNIGKDGFGMALRAGHAGVHAAQREPRLIVVEFRYSSDRLPATDGVAVLASDTQWTVGASRGHRSSPLCRTRHRQHEPN